MGVEEALKGSDRGTLVRVEVIPNSKERSLSYDAWRKAIVVRLRSPPRRGKANKELIDLFAEIFGNAELVRGESSRSKLVRVDLGVEEVAAKLSAILKRERLR